MSDKEKARQGFVEYKPFLQEQEFLTAQEKFEIMLETEEVAKENIKHCYTRIFPMIAIYLTLKEKSDDSLARVEEIFNKKVVYPGVKKMQRLMKIPFLYKCAIPLAKKIVKKSYKDSAEGFKIEVLDADKKTFQFKIHQCTYYNYCKKYQVPELCVIFCNSDDISGHAMKPHIIFTRENTLAKGGEYCDFCYRSKK